MYINKHFFRKVFYILCALIALFFNGTKGYSQYIEFGEYQYRIDKPPLKKYVTYSYSNILNVVDSASTSDRYTKEVIVINKKSHNAFLKYIKKHQPKKLDNIDPELYQYIRISNKNTKTIFYRFSSNGYKSYLIDLFRYIETSCCISNEDKSKLISKLGQRW